jgi:hypothetical protein
MFALMGATSARAAAAAHPPMRGDSRIVADEITADLRISQTLLIPIPLLPGQDDYFYRLNVQNLGATTANSVTVTNIIPSEIISTSFIFFGASVEKEISDGENYTWLIDSLEPNQTLIIFVSGIIDPALNSDVTIVSSAVITGGPDANPADNQASLALDVVVPTIQFNAATRTIQEDAAVVSVVISGTHPLTDSLSANPYADIRVDYTTVDGSATSVPADARDFVAASGTLTIATRLSSTTAEILLDDDKIVEGSEFFTVRLQNPFGAQLGARDTITITIDDDESPGVRIVPAALDAAEGGEAVEYTVALRSRPSAPVSVQVLPDDQLTTNVSELNFTPDNWNTPQAVQVTAIDDEVAELEDQHQGEVRHSTRSDDANYDELPDIAEVVVSIEDNDGAGLALSASSLSLVEGKSFTQYEIALTSQPRDPVTVTLVSDTQLTVSTTNSLGWSGATFLSFGPENWRDAQSVHVRAVDDIVAEDTHIGTILHSVDSVDPFYQQKDVSGVTATIGDNDSSGILLSAQSIDVLEGTVDENVASSYSMVLATQPTDLVTVSMEVDAPLHVTPTQVVFSPANWAIARLVAVTVDDDDQVQDERIAEIRHRTRSRDRFYDSLGNVALRVRVRDDDAAGLVLGGQPPLVVTEGGQNASYTIALQSQPTSTVTVAFAVDSQLSVQPAVLAFTPETWNVPQQVTVIATDDGIREGAHTAEIHHRVRSQDPFYDYVSTEPVAVAIADGVVRYDESVYLPLIQQ